MPPRLPALWWLCLVALSLGCLPARATEADFERARALAERTATLVDTQGFAGAQTLLQSDPEQFRDADLYVFLLDRSGVVQLHPDSLMVGVNVLQMRDLDGKAFIAELLIRAHEEERFWTAYRYANPATRQAEFKKVWVISQGDYVIASGAYVGLRRPE